MATVMALYRIHCVAIRSSSPERPSEALIGAIVSDVDLLRAGIRTRADHPAGAIAHTPVLTVYPSTPLADAADLMFTDGVSHLVVADRETNRPIGVISTFDVCGGLAWDAIHAPPCEVGMAGSRPAI